MNILTGLVRRTDADYSDFDSHIAKTYTMEKIPNIYQCDGYQVFPVYDWWRD